MNLIENIYYLWLKGLFNERKKEIKKGNDLYIH